MKEMTTKAMAENVMSGREYLIMKCSYVNNEEEK